MPWTFCAQSGNFESQTYFNFRKLLLFNIWQTQIFKHHFYKFFYVYFGFNIVFSGLFSSSARLLFSIRSSAANNISGFAGTLSYPYASALISFIFIFASASGAKFWNLQTPYWNFNFFTLTLCNNAFFGNYLRQLFFNCFFLLFSVPSCILWSSFTDIFCLSYRHYRLLDCECSN